MARTFERDLSNDSLHDPQARERLNLEIHPIKSVHPCELGPYRVTAFPANHDPAVEPLLFAVEADGRSIFYGLDTAELPKETWQAFHKHQMQFDLVVLDHTYGPDELPSDHLNAHQVIEHAARMRAVGLLAENGRVFASHIAHEGNPVHPELTAFASQHGYEIAYDGLTV